MASIPTVETREIVTTKFAMNNTAAQAQTSGAGQAALSARADGAHGLDTEAHMKEVYDLVVEIRATLVANGMMKGAA